MTKKIATELMNDWRGATDKTIVPEYLESRGLVREAFGGADLRGTTLRLFDEDGKDVGKHKAILARIVTRHNKVACLHRTYLLEDGTKKKITRTIREWTGGAIRLFKADKETLLVAEGIETALSVRWLYFTRQKEGSGLELPVCF